METKIKKLPKNLLEIIVELTPEEITAFDDEALKELGQKIQIAGFRPGKAPSKMIREQISDIKILEKMAELAINKNYPKIILKEKLNPAGPPKIEVQKLAPNNPFIFKLTVPLIPVVELGNYKRIKVKSKKLSIPQSEIDKTLKHLQNLRRKEAVVNRACQASDRVEIDLELFSDKVPLENGQMKNFSVVIGEDYYIPGLSENLKGLKRTEEKQFSLQYPASHYDKKLAGKKIDFKAKINNIYQIDLPPFDDKFAQSLGVKTVKELKEQIQKNLEAEAKNKEEQRLELEILKKLVEQTHFEEIPEILIQYELNKMILELKNAIEKQTPAPESQKGESTKFAKYLESIKKTEENLKKELVPKAEERIKTALCIRQIAQEEKIEVSPQEIKKETDKISALYKNQKELLENFKTEAGQTYLKNLLTNRKVIEWLKKE